ncbi:Perlucin-like protein [Collichthys lucidus]|uniref:Perlucin-like protein n=1 Tax=Collichthys lucidus TaxID=240159 RepID=A0A4U5V0K3_COLLU|nr:Perlucin-like protein [Collichthys lucidus]
MARFMLALLLATIHLPLDSTDKIHFNEDAKSWIDALEHCNKTGSYLVEILNNTTWETVNRDLEDETDKMEQGAWIGLERSIFALNEITWTWVLNGSLNKSKKHWREDFPTDEYNHHCGKIIQDKKNGSFMLLDEDCHIKLPFICQT